MNHFARRSAVQRPPHRRLPAENFFIFDPMAVKDQSKEDSLNLVVDRIVSSLKFPDTGRAAPIPEFDSLVDMLDRLRAIVYPGFRSNESSLEKVKSDLKTHLNETWDLLSRQIAIAVARHFEACESMAREDCNQSTNTIEKPADILQFSRDLATDYMARMPTIRERLVTDVTAAYVGDPACKNFDEVILCYPGLKAVTVYRLAHELYKMKVPFLPRMMAEWVHGETGIDIHPGAQIGEHFFIDHGTGVVIGETCVIGNHVKIYQGVTLGALSFPHDKSGRLIRDSKRHPTLQDNVVIYANATVLGGQTVVGKDSVIGSSVWLTHSVAPSTTVTMEKPKLRLRNPADQMHILDFQI